MERSGDLAKARELFLRIAAVDPDAYDVADRLESLGPPTEPGARRTGHAAPVRLWTFMTIEQLLGDEADSLLNHTAKAFPADLLRLPGPDHLDQVFMDSDRSAHRLAQPRPRLQHRTAGRHRVSLHPPGRPGYRALGCGQLRQIPRLFRSAKPVTWPSPAGCNAIATTFGDSA